MYWCKIAKTNEEFEAIARLNYETFVEEIPQHEVNASRKKSRPISSGEYLCRCL